MSVDRRYWDSDAFLGWLPNEQDKAPKCEGVLKAAEAGQLQIVTSALTLTEVIRLKGKPRLPRTEEDRIRAFFEHDWIVVRRDALKPRLRANPLIRLGNKPSAHQQMDAEEVVAARDFR